MHLCHTLLYLFLYFSRNLFIDHCFLFLPFFRWCFAKKLHSRWWCSTEYEIDRMKKIELESKRDGMTEIALMARCDHVVHIILFIPRDCQLPISELCRIFASITNARCTIQQQQQCNRAFAQSRLWHSIKPNQKKYVIGILRKKLAKD